MEHKRSMLTEVSRIVDCIVCHIEEKSIAISVIALASILVMNVILRSFNSSIASTEELSQFLMFYITFLGTSYAARSGMHIRMSMLSDAERGRSQKALAIVVSLGTAIAMFYVSWLCYRYVMKVASFNRVSPILLWPVHYVWIVMPIGMFLTGVQYLLAFIKNITSPGAWISYSVRNECEPTALSNFDEQVLAVKSSEEKGVRS